MPLIRRKIHAQKNYILFQNESYQLPLKNTKRIYSKGFLIWAEQYNYLDNQ